MKILVNTRLLIKNKLDGIGWFTFETLKRIIVQHPEHQFVFAFDRPFSEDFVFSSNIKPLVVSPMARHPFLYYLWFEFSIPSVFRRERPDIFLSPDGFLSLSADSKIKQLGVIHDLNFEEYPKDLPYITSNYYRYYFPKFSRRATRLATVSEFSKQDITKRYKISPDRIDVVYNGANENYVPVSETVKDETRKTYAQGCSYFLFIGTLHPRKNITRLLRAFDGFKKAKQTDTKLLIVGSKMWWTSEMEEAYATMEFQKDVVFAGRLEPEQLGRVAASALAMMYVSTYEGFGIPILEAMNCDVPVITSNVTSMPEIAGDAALLVNPFSVDSIKEGMLKISSDEKFRMGLIEKGRRQREKFSWQKTADKLWVCVEKTMC